MTPFDAMLYLGPILISVGVYGVFLKRKLDRLEAQDRETHSAE
jgi:NADH:ubiquinone oxidoreductase subunit K